jgi:hypothetical protein
MAEKLQVQLMIAAPRKGKLVQQLATAGSLTLDTGKPELKEYEQALLEEFIYLSRISAAALYRTATKGELASGDETITLNDVMNKYINDATKGKIKVLKIVKSSDDQGRDIISFHMEDKR